MATLKRNKGLAKKAEDNTTIQKKSGGEVETIKSGTPLDHSSKHDPKSGPIVGMSKGVTKHMDNYESLRVDCWLTDTVEDNETVEQAYERIIGQVDKVLQDTVNSYSE